MTPDRGMPDRRVPQRGFRSVAASLMLCLAWTGLSAAQERVPLVRLAVPADEPETWPAGDWVRAPFEELEEFERALAEGDGAVQPPPQFERVVFRGVLVEPTVLEGEFTAQVRRLDARRSFLELGRISPAVRQLVWSDGPAIWGSGSDGRSLLYVDRGRDELSGEWALRGTSRFDGAEFDVRLPRASSIRLELQLPDDRELTSSDGLVLPPQPGEEGQRLWSIELGRTNTCLCTIGPAGERRASAASVVEWTAAYVIQPDGCRLQWDFNVLLSSPAPSVLEFEIPEELEAPEATTGANAGLSAQLVTTDGRRRLIVPMPRGATGRLGTIRISGGLALRAEEAWSLPEVRLAGATTVSGVRRVHVDRPLTLQSLTLQGVRQTTIQQEESGVTWGFEDLSANARLVVRVGRPATLLGLRAVTAVELSRDEARFRTAAQLTSHGDSVYSAELQLPTGWGVIDVVTPGGESGGMSSWRAIETDAGILLVIEFRQALTSHTPRQVLISGRRVSWNLGAQEIELFPRLSGDDGAESQVVLAVRRDAAVERLLTPQGGARALSAGDAMSEWGPLAGVLNLEVGDATHAWFAQTGRVPQGAVSAVPADSAKGSGGLTTAAGGGDVPAPDAPLVLDLRMETDVGERGAVWHRHRARYVLGGRRPDAPPKVRLPAELEFDGVAVDGRPQNVVSMDGSIELLEWSPQAREVEIRYRSPAAEAGGWLRRPVDVELPDWGQPVRQLEWRLKLPSSERVADVRGPRSTIVGKSQSGWLQRCFGVLARMNGESAAVPGAVLIGVLAPGPSVEVDLVDLTNQQRASWLGLLAACLAVGSCRVWRGELMRWAWWWMVVPAVGVIVLPDGWAEVCGSVLTGALLGQLLPRSWLAPQRGVTLGAGSVVRPAGASAGTVVLVLCAWYGGNPADAQSERVVGASVSENGSSAAAEFDVLVPVRDGAAERDARIQRRLLPAFEAWRAAAQDAPAWLLQRARYVFTPGHSPQLEAEFTVAVFARQPIVPVTLAFGRLWVADPDDCRVDGKPAQIRPSAETNALLVEVPGVPAGEGELVRTVGIELRLQPGAAARSGSGWEFDVPAVLDAQLRLPTGESPSEQFAASSQRSVGVDDAGRMVFEPGGVGVLSVQPAAGVSTEAPGGSLAADAVSLIEVHPLRLRVRTQMTMVAAPGGGAVDAAPRLRVVLPGQAEVREVIVPGFRRFSVRRLRDGQTLLDLELERPPAADTTVSIDYSLPSQWSGGVIMIPPMPLREDGGLRSHRLGLRGMSGIVLETVPSAVPSGPLREMPAELFAAGLATDTAWPAPTHVYVATAPTGIPVEATPVEPLRTASLEQSLLVDGDAIRWQGTAEINVAVAPAFRHELELSADVQLESVAVVQDGAERLLDWARYDDRLVLYLVGDRIGRHEVRLSGTLRADLSQATPFPRFALRDATTIASELLVQSGPSRRLELFAADGSMLPAGPASGAAASGAAPFIRRFSLQDAALPAAFRSVPSPAPLSLTLVTRIERRDGAWELVTEFYTDRPLAADESVLVRVPKPIAGSIATVLPTVLTAGEADDTVRLSGLSGTDRQTSVLTLRAPLETPEHGEWQAPRFEALQATVSDELVVVPREFPFAPAAGVADPATWPEALRDRQGAEALAAGTVVYRWTGEGAVFTERTPALETPEIRLVESGIWRDRDGSVAGTTTFWIVARQSTCTVRLPWPGSARLNTAEWDDQPLALKPDADAHVVCRRDGLVPGSVHRLRLDWDSAAGVLADAGGALWRPRCEHATGVTEVAAILPRGGYFAFSLSAPVNRVDALRQRTSALLELWDAAAFDGSGREALAGEIESALSALAALSREAAGPLRAEWVERQSAADASLPVAASAARPTPFAAMVGADDRAVLLNVRAGSPGIAIREVHTGLAMGAAGIAVALIGVLVWQFREIGRRAVIWSALNGEAFGVCLLGAGWWLWLKAGVIGVVLLAAGGAMQWRYWRGRTAEASQIDV